ncbi:craniofacial development protein 2-like [Polistes fuscatus]|uniref:craniofacial development protein 2-like n=1 Tax=Polistes fuscatus TaxID=30207 RepID=UPI001CA82F44|nr:craniofacial development protein 2-like [Polistes fuscatus]
MDEVILELKNMKVDIAVVTEIKKKGQGSQKLGYYDHFYSGVPKHIRAQQGVSIFIHRTLRKHITSWEAINERMIKVNMNIYGYRTTILGVYGVNEDALVANKDEFYEQLNDEIVKVGNTREIILLGDLNGRTGNKKQDDVVGRYGEEMLNDNGTKIINMCKQNNLRIMSGFFQHRCIHKYTRTQPTMNQESIIDYLLIKQRSRMKINDVRVYRGATCDSDYHLLKAKILFPRIKSQKDLIPREEDSLSVVISVSFFV